MTDSSTSAFALPPVASRPAAVICRRRRERRPDLGGQRAGFRRVPVGDVGEAAVERPRELIPASGRARGALQLYGQPRVEGGEPRPVTFPFAVKPSGASCAEAVRRPVRLNVGVTAHARREPDEQGRKGALGDLAELARAGQRDRLGGAVAAVDARAFQRGGTGPPVAARSENGRRPSAPFRPGAGTGAGTARRGRRFEPVTSTAAWAAARGSAGSCPRLSPRSGSRPAPPQGQVRVRRAGAIERHRAMGLHAACVHRELVETSRPG